MSDIDPDATRVVETRTSIDPVTGTTEVTRTTVRSSTGAWVLITVVAVVAMIAIGFMVTRQPSPAPDNQALAAAADQGRAQGAADAQNASAQASLQAAQSAAQSQAAQAADARAQAQSSAADAAASAARSREAQPKDAAPPPTDGGDQTSPQS